MLLVDRAFGVDAAKGSDMARNGSVRILVAKLDKERESMQEKQRRDTIYSMKKHVTPAYP